MRNFFIAASALLLTTAAQAQPAKPAAQKPYSSNGISLTPACKDGKVRFDFSVTGESPMISGMSNLFYVFDDGSKDGRRVMNPPKHKGRGTYEVIDDSEETSNALGLKFIGVTVSGHVEARFAFRPGDAYEKARIACHLGVNHLRLGS